MAQHRLSKYFLAAILAAYRELVRDNPPAIKVVRRAVESSLKRLVEQGVLMQHGKGRAAF